MMPKIWLLNVLVCGIVAGAGFYGSTVRVIASQNAPLPETVKINVGHSTQYSANCSGYCLCEKCCNGWSKVYPRRTASGHIIKPGDKFLAALKSIPFGTMIAVPGYNDGLPAPVLDRGGAIKSDKLDCFFDSHSATLKFGRQNLIVKVGK